MKALQEKIRKEGSVKAGDIIKVDSFLNHQLDVAFLNEIGKEFFLRFKNAQVDKLLTCEASGIAISTVAALHFKVPVVFAKKTPSKNLDPEVYSGEVYSYTKKTTYQVHVSRRYLKAHERILILDDFLANGETVRGLKEIIDQAEALLVGVGIVVEKAFQPGGTLIRSQGVHLESLAVVEKIQDGTLVFQGESNEV